MVWSAGYAAFGAVVVDPSSTVENNLRFPGQYADAETGLCWNFQRYYDPGNGRYSQVDPIGFAGGDVDLYGYVGNGVTANSDPLGLAPGDVYLFWGGDLAPYIAKFSKGPYGHAAIEISGNRFLSAGLNDYGKLRVYIKNAENELGGRSFDVYRPTFPTNIDGLDRLAREIIGSKYLEGNVCSETTSRAISVMDRSGNLFDWSKYLFQVSPNNIAGDQRFNDNFNWYSRVEYKDGYYRVILDSGSYLTSKYK